ncbi:hypothetical protein CROQUDRAFT_290523 [Cronartium quercuum f. sp. fusiforme G11]|uniref:Hamartin n=1 Tax=Cronartium quercuum f. sp. fusiforme G11 TaxID=708437 RepID=A0A9P6TFH3_9BASI|nr:hypothetical protein CROQUDRAFT_290523 [Cronartium quercuum f. sp. fusiforme G11]
MSYSTGPSTLKDLSSILKTYFSPIRVHSSTTHQIDPEDVIKQAEMLVSELGQQEGAGGGPDRVLALREKTVKTLMGSLLELGQQLETDDEADEESHRLSSTLLVVLEHLYTDERARELLVDKLNFHLFELWWTNLLKPSVVRFPTAIDPTARASLVNLLVAELGSSTTTGALAEELFEAYCAVAHDPDRLSSESVLRTILVKWGKARPRDYFNFLDSKITIQPILDSGSDHPRLVALTVLVEFITSWPYSTHHILHTNLVDSLVDHIIRAQPSLPVLQINIQAILLILPRIPICLESLLPRLFLGFGRSVVRLNSSDIQQPLPASPAKIDSALLEFFSFLYGLFPCNFLDFLRNPSEYLEAYQSSNISTSLPYSHIDSESIKRYTIPLLTQHRLCPSLIESNPSSERNEISNQLKLFESAELIEKCERNLIISAHDPKLSQVNPSLEALSEAICRALGLPTTAASRKRRSTSLPDRAPAQGEPELGNWPYGALRTQTLLLKTKLNVELYLKHQHLQQMGSLHKQNILSTGLESEIQNLHTINRELRRKLEIVDQADSTKLEQELKQKTNTISYHQLVKDRTARYREEKIELTEQKKELINRLNQLQSLYDSQTKELMKAEIEAHGLRNELKLTQPKLESLDELQTKNEALTKALLTWDDDLRRFRESRKQIDILRGEWKRFESLANRTQIDNEELRTKLQRQMEINHDLQTLISSNSRNGGREVKPNQADATLSI